MAIRGGKIKSDNTGATRFMLKAFLSLHNILVLLDTNWMHPVGQLIHSTKLEYDE